MKGSLPSPAPGRRRRINTTARVQSAIKAAQAAGLVVRRVTIDPDGAIAVETGEVNQPVAKTNNPKTPQGASWDDI
jgi:glucose/arabinose dehydrogenase